MEARTPGQRAGLSHAEVVACARALLDEGGLEALTMRRVARRLGVAPNALYSHVESKTGLVDAVLDDVLGGVEAPPAGADPAAGLAALMRATLAVLLDHPGLVPAFVTRQGARGPNARRLGTVMLELLGRAGIAGEAAAQARRVLIVHTIGFAAIGADAPLERADRPVPAGEIARSHEWGLRWLLAGILAHED